jgi:hypothetical protein
MRRILFLTLSLIISFNLLNNYQVCTKKAYAVDEPPEILRVYNNICS